jgi:hypothetical protein
MTALLPGLAEHHRAAGRPGGFTDAMARGTYFGHVTEHVALELSRLAGRDVHLGRVDIASDKVLTKQLLASAGIPVPDGVVAWSPQEAAAQASAGGAGVIVEAFVPGLDYRVLVVDGQVVAAAELRPAAVTGDGSRNIGQLIELANADPRRGPGHARELTRITLDAAAIGHTPERQPVDRRHQPGCHRSGPRPGRRDRAAAAGRLAQPMEPRPLISARAITVRRMSLVPSPITISGASR